MYEVHGWFGLAESVEVGDAGGLSVAVRDLGHMLRENEWMNLSISIVPLNGQYFLNITGAFNRRRAEAIFIDDVLEYVRERLPGSWGLLYERDDESAEPDVKNVFRVKVLARGRLTRQIDPFLSPCVPTIED